MYSGFLPKGLTEADLSPEDEEVEQEDDVEERRRRVGEKCEGSAGKLNSTVESTSSVVEARSTAAAGDADSEYPTHSMPGISQEMWQVCGFAVS